MMHLASSCSGTDALAYAHARLAEVSTAADRHDEGAAVNVSAMLLTQLEAVRERVAASARASENVHFTICNTLNKTRKALLQEPDSELAKAIELLTEPVQSSSGDPPYPEKAAVALMVCNQLIGILKSDMARTQVASAPAASISRIAPDSRTVFIVHGHDETNLLRLNAMLKDRFQLKPVILMDEASAGETVIEKFERVAGDAAFCIVLLTPDDQIAKASEIVVQARPNAIFELGWFYGRLGRSRVCILMKRGTTIHSDLAGIVRIEFIEKVEEAVAALEKELARADLLG